MDQIQKISNELGKLAASSKVATLDTNNTSDTCPIMMLQYGYTSAGKKLGILWDSASYTNYCTNKLADKLMFRGEPFTLVINGIAGIRTEIESMKYVCGLKTKLGTIPIVMYGIDNIACVDNSVETEKLVKLFSDFSAKRLERPLECDVLLSQAKASLMPSKKCAVGNLVLWDGPMGIVVSGSHQNLKEASTNYVQTSSTHLAFSLKAFSESCETVGRF